MDNLNLIQTYHDTSLMYWWEYCRLVGLINKVYFILVLSTLVITGSLYALLIGISCIVCDTTHGDTNHAVYDECMLCGLFIVYCLILWPYMIIFLIIPIGLLKMVYVNNGLRSTNIPTSEKNVKTWLRYHIAFLILWLISLSGLLNENHSAKSSHFIYTAIQCIILMIEISVVHKFNTEYKISADRRNRSFEISNDI